MSEDQHNPFTMVYTALWDLVLGHAGLAALVKEGNRIRMDDPQQRDPLKATVAVADLPELRLDVSTSECNLHSSSSTSSVTRRYSWVASTGDYRYTHLLAQVEWGLLCGMLDWRTKLAALRWRGQSFVKDVNMPTWTAGYSDPAANRGIQGWSKMAQVDVVMHFRTSDLLEEATSGRLTC